MINLSQILNKQTWHTLKRDFEVVINTFSAERKEVEEARKVVSKRIAKYKNRDVIFMGNYPCARIESYIQTFVDAESDKEYLSIVFKINLNLTKEVEL